MDILNIKKSDLQNADFIIEIGGSSGQLINGLHKIVSINPMPIIKQKKQSKHDPYWLWHQKGRN